MKAVAVKELKNKLSVYLREVRQGEVVLVTDRGKVVAEIRRPSVEAVVGTREQTLAQLHAEGLIVPGLPQNTQAYKRTKVRLTGASQALLDADRAER